MAILIEAVAKLIQHCEEIVIMKQDIFTLKLNKAPTSCNGSKNDPFIELWNDGVSYCLYEENIERIIYNVDEQELTILIRG